MEMKDNILAKATLKINDDASSEPLGPVLAFVSVKVPFLFVGTVEYVFVKGKMKVKGFCSLLVCHRRLFRISYLAFS